MAISDVIVILKPLFYGGDLKGIFDPYIYQAVFADGVSVLMNGSVS